MPTSTTRHGLAVVLMLMAALIGCAAPVADEPVQVRTEDLNIAPDFQVGVVVIKYVNNRPIRGQYAWTKPVGQAVGAGELEVDSGWTFLPNGYQHPDGIRVGIQRIGDPWLGTFATDFRITLQAMNDIHVGTRPGPVVVTRWASEGGGGPSIDPSTGGERAAVDGVDNISAEAYAIGVQMRPWPASASMTLFDFKLGLQGCVTNATGTTPDVCTAPSTQFPTYTGSLAGLANGDISWSHTADAGNLGRPDGEYIYLSPFFQ